MTRSGTMICGLLVLGFAISRSDEPAAGTAAPVAVVALPHEGLQGKGLEAVPPYRKELRLAGLQQVSAREIFNGAIVIDVWETQDGGTLLLKNYPFDQYVQVLAGTTTLNTNDGSSRTFVTGDAFVVPRGFKGTWTLSQGFRELLIIESKSLQEGIGQFE